MVIDAPIREVVNHGQVQRLLVPAGWVEKEVERGPMQLWTLKEFHPPDQPSVRLYIYYRGYPVSERSGEAFESLLEKPPHDLDQSEWWSVQEVVGNAALPAAFQPRRTCTYDWDKRRVLVVDGHWPRAQEDSFDIYINAADHGCQIQELHFVAPTGEYQDFLAEALLVLNSIEWKTETSPISE